MSTKTSILTTLVLPKRSYLFLILHYSKQTQTKNCGMCLPGSTFPYWLLLMSLVLSLGLQSQCDRLQHIFNYVTWYVLYI